MYERENDIFWMTETPIMTSACRFILGAVSFQASVLTVNKLDTYFLVTLMTRYNKSLK